MHTQTHTGSVWREHCEGKKRKIKNVFTKAPKAASESDSDCNGYSFSAQPRCCSRSCRIRSELNPRRCSSSQSQPTVHGCAALHLNNPDCRRRTPMPFVVLSGASFGHEEEKLLWEFVLSGLWTLSWLDSALYGAVKLRYCRKTYDKMHNNKQRNSQTYCFESDKEKNQHSCSS